MKRLAGALIAGLCVLFSVQAQNRKTEVWDFGGIEEKGAVNHITIAKIDELEVLAADGKFSPGDITFGDLTVNVEKNDRAYYDGKKNYGSQGYASTKFEDEYCSGGMYYCNGKGGEGKRYLLLKNVRSGDTITFYARLSNSGEEKVHFASVDDKGQKEGSQDETGVLSTTAKAYTYTAVSSGTYKVYAEATAGKPVFFRIKRVPGVEVSGTIASLPQGKAVLNFVNQETKQSFPASISGSTYKTSLAPGASYTAVLSEIKGWGISSQTKELVIAGNVSGALKKNLTAAEQKTFEISGKINGIDASYKSSDMELKLLPPQGSAYLPVSIPCRKENGQWIYRGDIEPSVSYSAVLEGAKDYQIKGKTDFEGTQAFTKDITLEKRPVYEVSGSFFGGTETPSAVKFKNLEDGYVYEGTVSGGKYSAKLRDGNYEADAETPSYRTMNHIVVKGKAVSKDIKLSPKTVSTAPLKLKKKITVGAKKGDYRTVREAVAAAKAMAPKSEADRITIHIAPGVYREQVIIDVPYITLMNDTPEKEVKLTWYYGIGYKYYSADLSGFYNEDNAYDKFSKAPAVKWGAATYVKASAEGFRAEGITFEASFNRYVTDEEIADGVEADGSLPFVRKLNSDVRSKAATERSAAICVEADRAEFLKCRFLGVQDTLYTGKNLTKQYYRNCYIEGNTDFIFGEEGNTVFDSCEICWSGYSDTNQSGYITAVKNSKGKGYLFYNCLITQDSNSRQAPGYLGRPWEPAAKVAWINTILSSENVILPEGWTDMSGNKPENAGFAEFNTMWNDSPADTSRRTPGKVLISAAGYDIETWLEGWKSAYYTKGISGEPKLKKLTLTTDDDINTPYPGHTITLHYSLGKFDSEDESLIQWYRVKDGKETLVKQSTGFADKTYLLKKEDSNSRITVKVTPKTRGSKKLAPVTQKLEAEIREGYAVPANAARDIPRAEGKVNIFLASDSTCKDYSAQGMWSQGKTRNEGAWGEFLQAFFSSNVSVQNYANGGRSTRNFINEGTLDKIAANISKGDWLFIQFGHNDCHNETGYLEDRFVPLGIPDSKGIYPVTEGKKVPTPASYSAKYGDLFYSWDCGGTYKWYLKQYIEVARKAGATPVLVTPVARKYFADKGKIRLNPHHDSEDTGKKNPAAKYATKNNAYVEAVKQLAKDENVILIDGFEFTKALYEKAYADNGNDSQARAIMSPGDSTHNNKLGGFALAAEFAKAIKKQIPELAPSIIHPAKVIGENADGSLMFTVNSSGKIECENKYWKEQIQKSMDSIK